MLIFRKYQLCIVPSMFFMFCQVSGSCFYKIDHYKALFLKTFSLEVSLKLQSASSDSAETSNILYILFVS